MLFSFVGVQLEGNNATKKLSILLFFKIDPAQSRKLSSIGRDIVLFMQGTRVRTSVILLIYLRWNF
jgi:hypothetical protein